MTRRISPDGSQTDPRSNHVRTGPRWVLPVLGIALLLVAGATDDGTERAATKPVTPHAERAVADDDGFRVPRTSVDVRYP